MFLVIFVYLVVSVGYINLNFLTKSLLKIFFFSKIICLGFLTKASKNNEMETYLIES